MTGFGSFLKELRGERSLREMERATGLSHTYLSSLEKGVDPRSGKERKPTPTTLKLLSETLQVDYSKLMKEVGYLPKEKNQLTIGEYIKQGRKKSRRTLREFAFDSGISHPYISQLENGRNSSPSREILWKLAKELSVDLKDKETTYNEMLLLVGYEKDNSSALFSKQDLSHVSTDDLLAEVKRRTRTNEITEKLRKALEFYANEKTYREEFKHIYQDWGVKPINEDRGAIARKALSDY